MRGEALGLCGDRQHGPRERPEKALEKRRALPSRPRTLRTSCGRRAALPCRIPQRGSCRKEYAGFSPAEKLDQLRNKLKELGCTARLWASWIIWHGFLNLRAMDIECTPYAMAYCYVTPAARYSSSTQPASPRRQRQSWKPTASRWRSTTIMLKFLAAETEPGPCWPSAPR